MSSRTARVSAALLIALAAGAAQSAAPLSIDASAPVTAPETGTVTLGSAKAPDGRIIGLNSRYLTLDGKPWLPVMGEFHYTRFPARYWEEQILKMKAAGIGVISTYVIWQHHEESEGRFDWSGDRDLHRFIELCQKHGLMVFLRPGPWAHAEVRFGGIPDWVVDSMSTRRNDPAYLAAVDRFYRQIAKQAHGLLWKDGGPIIGVQVENEYNLAGPGQGRDHISRLKKILVTAGLDVPLYTVTGWDDTIFPQGEVTPVFGGYPDEPWDASRDKLPPKTVYSFQFGSRAGKGLGAETEAAKAGDEERDRAHTPFLSAEYGGGVPTMYRRRPIIQPDDVAAMLPVGLGSGVNLYGYYMFQGGRNPAGLPTRQESTAIGGYNDLPAIGYDFGAPLGEYGQAHPVMAKIRPFHSFLQNWGAVLAPMAVHAPVLQPTGPDDLSTLRFSVRSLDQRGFVFVNNHVRQYKMAEQHGVQFAVTLPGGPLVFPQTPVDIPADSYFIWPFNLDLGGATLSWATAQPLTRIADVTVLHAIDGIPVELAFDATTTRSVEGPVTVTKAGGHLIAQGLVAGHEALLTITGQNGSKTRLLVLTQQQAERSWTTKIGGNTHLVETEAQLFTDGGSLTFRSLGNPLFRLSLFPALTETPSANIALIRAKDEGAFEIFEAQAAPLSLKAAATPTRPALPVPPIAIGGLAKAAIEPTPETFGDSAAWSIDIAGIDWKQVSDAYLRIDYQGDVARLFSGNVLIDDHFYTGIPWEIGLKRFAGEIKRPLTVSILPVRQDAPIYFEDGMRPSGDAQIARISRLEVVPEYELKLINRQK